MKKEKVFVHMTANLIIICVLLMLYFGTATSSITVLSNAPDGKAIYRGNSDENRVSLMFNVYWGNEYIDGILEQLDNFDVKATFFVGGSWVSKYPEILKKINENGHEIANHGFLHKDHKKINEKQNFDEIIMTEKVINELIGKKTDLFAPPSGSFGNFTMKICKENNYKMIMWSKDTIDWRDKDSDLIFKRATNNIKNGELILAHPTEQTLKALPLILAFYKKNNFKQTTVSENILPTVS